MKKFALVEVIEREICVSQYETKKEATDEMLRRFHEVCDQGEPDVEFWDSGAWANTNHPGRCDWKIVELE